MHRFACSNPFSRSELERVSDHVVVLDAGRMLRSAATADFTQTTGILLVEVVGGWAEQYRMGQALVDAGFAARPHGDVIEVEVSDPQRHDVIRDLACDLDLGLVRMQQHHRQIGDVFREGGAGSVPPV